MKRMPLELQRIHAAQFHDKTPVIVTDDRGEKHNDTVIGEPWCLGGHTMVVNTTRFHSYHITRLEVACV